MADAACAEHPELEFVLLPGGVGTARIEQRKAVCRRCLVRQECLNYALADSDLTGVWGTTTTRERREYRGQSRGNVGSRRPPVSTGNRT